MGVDRRLVIAVVLCSCFLVAGMSGSTVGLAAVEPPTAAQTTDAAAGDTAVGMSVTTATTTSHTINISVVDSQNGRDNATTGITVQTKQTAAPLNVSVSPQTVTADQSTDVTVTVTNGSSGNAVEAASVSISSLGLSATTAANGEATLPVNASSTGTLTVDVSATNYKSTNKTISVRTAGSGGLPQVSNVDQAVVNAVATSNSQAGLQRLEVLNAWNSYVQTGSVNGLTIDDRFQLLDLWSYYVQNN